MRKGQEKKFLSTNKAQARIFRRSLELQNFDLHEKPSHNNNPKNIDINYSETNLLKDEFSTAISGPNANHANDEAKEESLSSSGSLENISVNLLNETI